MMNCPTTMMCPLGGAGSSAFFLIAVALGYWVLTLADNQANLTKKIGQVVGWLVLIVSLSGLLCTSFSKMCRKSMCDSKGGMMGAMGECPHMAKMKCHTDGMAPVPQEDAPKK